MSDFSWRQSLRYRFDNFMSRGGSSIFISLLVVFVVLLVFIFGLRLSLYWFFPEAASQHPSDILTNLYITFLEMTDPGNMAQDISSSPWFKVTAILSGSFGIVMLSALIAFITTALDQKLSELKKGHSKVVESGHTLILGWNDRRVIEILRELVEANESEDDPSLVILADKDKEFMDDYLKTYMPYTGNTRVVTRSGETSSLVDLDIVSVGLSKSCIILAACSDSDSLSKKYQSDAKVIKSVLAVQSSMADTKDFNIVAEIFDQRYQSVAESISQGNVTIVESRDLLSKILVQTSRSVGLSVVYNEVLSFEGCEMYFYNTDWRSIKFGQAVFRFQDGVPMGIRHRDGKLVINPDVSTVLSPGDDLLILAEDNDTIDFEDSPIVEAKRFTLPEKKYHQKVEHELIIGWSAKLKTILQEYSDYVLEGSSIDIIPGVVNETVRNNFEILKKLVPNIKLNLLNKNTSNEKDLLSLDLPKYDNIIILSPNVEKGEEERADSETILQLLLLRSAYQKVSGGNVKTKIITEILDSSNMELASKAGVHDFIISNRFVSMLIAQISESKNIKKVYDDLFSEDGSEIYLKSADLYFDKFPVELSFADMIGIAQRRNEICMGLKLKSQEKNIADNFGVKLNPSKDARYTLTANDSLVVLSEDET